MQILDWIDQSNLKSVQKYEDVLRKRLKKLGYHLSKQKTIQPGPPHIELKRGSRKRGFRITEIASGAIVDGGNYELNMADVDRFWLNEYKQWYVKRREDRDRKQLKK